MKRKENGEGSIYFEEARNKYRAMMFDPTGKRVTKRFNTREEAQEWLHQMHADISRDNYTPSQDITLMEWIIKYIEMYKAPKVKQTTLTNYMTTIKKLIPIGSIKLQSLTPMTIMNFYAGFELKNTPTHDRVHELLKMVSKKAVQTRIIAHDFMDGVELKKTIQQNKKPPAILSDDEIKLIADSLNKSGTKYKAFKIAINTGMRVGEIAGLEIKNVFPDHIYVEETLQQAFKNTVYKSSPKTSTSKRNIPISPALYQYIKEIIGGRTEGPVIVNRQNHPIRQRSFSSDWGNFARDINLSCTHFHALRHTFASKLIANGVPIPTVSKVLGHANTRITMEVYVHAVPELDTQISAVADKIFNV